MNKLSQLKEILCRKVKINMMDGKPDERNLDINLCEIADEMGSTSSDVLTLLNGLQQDKEIKRLQPNGFNKKDYILTVLADSSILKK